MQLARVGDIATGVCTAHKHPIQVTGILGIGSVQCLVDGRGAVRVGDIVTFSCGHTGVVASGSSLLLIDGRGMARVGDNVVGPMTAIIISGSPKSDAS